METIKNYLESMFRGLPLTEKVMKAKSELLQMMEDKYTELIRSGKTENEAVGEVIQNFGNLDDLADDLGIKEILYQSKYSEVQRRKLSFEEVTEYLEVGNLREEVKGCSSRTTSTSLDRVVLRNIETNLLIESLRTLCGNTGDLIIVRTAGHTSNSQCSECYECKKLFHCFKQFKINK